MKPPTYLATFTTWVPTEKNMNPTNIQFVCMCAHPCVGVEQRVHLFSETESLSEPEGLYWLSSKPP